MTILTSGLKQVMLPTCNSFYKVLTNQSNTYTKNTPFDFRFAFLEELNFETNQWEVALCDIQLSRPAGVTFEASLWVYCDIVEETQVGDKKETLLRRISTTSTRGATFYMTFLDKTYLSIRRTSIREVAISIKGLQQKKTTQYTDNSAQIKRQLPTTATLHFRRRNG